MAIALFNLTKTQPAKTVSTFNSNSIPLSIGKSVAPSYNSTLCPGNTAKILSSSGIINRRNSVPCCEQASNLASTFVWLCSGAGGITRKVKPLERKDESLSNPKNMGRL
jgi:hypothetical protein